MNKPSRDDCAPYYQKYIDELPAGNILEILGQQLSETLKVFNALDEQRARYRYAPGKWSCKELLGHLIDSERVFVYRATCFARNDSGPLPGMDENLWVAHAGFDARDLAGLIDEYEHGRRTSIAFFKGLDDETASRRGVASNCEFTAGSFPFIIAGHERHHLDVIRERYLNA